MEVHCGNQHTKAASKTEMLIVARPAQLYGDPKSFDDTNLSDIELGRGRFIPAPAGGVDAAAAALVEGLNRNESYVTTSSCAGSGKSGGRWLFSSHDGIKRLDVERAHLEASSSVVPERVSLKFEPPIAHVRCASLAAADRLIGVAIQCGFRESGAVSLRSPAGPMVAIRTTGAALDAPLGVWPGEWRGAEYVAAACVEAERRLGRERRKLDALTDAVAALREEAPVDDIDMCDVAIVATASARRVKVALGAEFRKEFSIAKVDEGVVAVPATEKGIEALRRDGPPVERFDRMALPRRRKEAKKTYSSAADALQAWAASLVPDNNTKWAKLGHDAVLVPAEFCAGLDEQADLWARVATATRARRLFRDSEVVPDGARSSRRRLLHPPGGDPWVTVREGGISYSFDATATMFCFGNNSERLRHAAFDCREDVVADLYAGIGYFAIPMMRAGAKFLHACEWAPATAVALRRNLAQNGVSDRCAVYEMDNALAAVSIGPVATRVSLGLTPTSRAGWPVACAVLHPRGGVLHVHENHKVVFHNDDASSNSARRYRDAFDQWGARVAREFQQLLCADRTDAPRWSCSCLAVSRVKSYAPHVFHLVADLRCTPSAAD
ncbi:hypothetical protein CTAYLR_006086 [Chrysophaeum taylorii]|uniref:SAM-dependent methyltransferase TRM5/TYW2-type domain-containing protein n=1 Tax=Chrysophaeum taylorii TaxID=2483200 RepID=A0AAD7ULU9_9STRA|nr:hypothetical protein CTAYLR_006086 [Chrysophaeum taylorii]